jgi:hypothetical protein
MTGYIKIYRSLLGHWIIEDAEKFRKWMIILLSVNYKPAKVAIGNSLYTVDAGQAMFSIQTWADKLGTSKKGVLAFFDLLKKDGMISTETVGKGNRSSTRVTVENYACYQGADAPEELPQGKRKGNREGIREGITSKEREERKEEKEGKKKTQFQAPELSEVIQYVQQNGFLPDIAKQFYAYYTENNWVKTNNKRVENWKLTMQTWMARPDNQQYKIQNNIGGTRYVPFDPEKHF